MGLGLEAFAVIPCPVDWLQLKVRKRVFELKMCFRRWQSKNSTQGLEADSFFCALLDLAGFVTMSVCRFDLSGVRLATGFQDSKDEKCMSQESSL